MITTRAARSIFAISVVLTHILFVGYVAIRLSPRITNDDLLVSTIAAFLPVFGVYVGVIVQNISLTKGPAGRLVSYTFLSVILLLFFANIGAVVVIVEAYAQGRIASEAALPGYLALSEAAFGGFFSTMFFSLFGVSASKEP